MSDPVKTSLEDDLSADYGKITAEKVWEGQGQPYWLSVNGGTVKGTFTITGNEFVTGNVTVTGNETVTGITTVNSLLATTANIGTLTASGLTTLDTVNTGAINQAKVGFASYVLGASLTGTVISPLSPSTVSVCSVAMACTDVVYTTPGYVTFLVNNNFPFAVGQSITVANTVNWNGTYQVFSTGTGTITCNTENTSPSEPAVTALVIPLFSAGIYNVSGICRIRQSVAPTPGSTTEGISFGLDIGTSAPANYTVATVQATNNPLYTITGTSAEAVFPITGTVRVTAPLSRLWLVVSTGALTGTYDVIFRQFTVTPIGVFRA